MGYTVNIVSDDKFFIQNAFLHIKNETCKNKTCFIKIIIIFYPEMLGKPEPTRVFGYTRVLPEFLPIPNPKSFFPCRNVC